MLLKRRWVAASALGKVLARRPALVLFGLLVVVGSCRDDITGPRHAPSGNPNTDISDAVNNGGNAHFYFLPPMLPQPRTSGVADGTLNPFVLVCEWDGATDACVAPVVGFSRSGGTGSEAIRYDAAGEHYIVNWHTDKCVEGECTLDPAKIYRLSVYIGAAQLGYADVKPVSSASQLRNVQTNENIGLVNGRTLPVKFRIEQGAISVLGPASSAVIGSAGGAVTTESGEAALEIPAGALSGETAITIAPAAAYPDGPGEWAQPMEFGPSGTAFEKTVTLSLTFDPRKLPDGVNPADMAIYHFDGTGWVLVEGGEVDVSRGIASAPISHFSVYSIQIHPNAIQGQPAPDTIAVGDSTTISGYAVGYSTYEWRSCSWSWDGTFHPEPICKEGSGEVFYPLSTAVYWGVAPIDGTFSFAVAVPPNPVYPAKDGTFSSGGFVGRRRGQSDIWAQTCESDCLRSNPVRVTVWERLVTEDVFAVIPALAPGQVVTGQVSLPSARSVSVPLSVTNSDSAVTVIASDENLAQVTKSGAIFGGEAGTFPVPTDQQGIFLDYIGNKLGASTVSVSAPEYFGVAEITIEVMPGQLRFDGIPESLQVGDSVEIRLTVLRPDGEEATLVAQTEGVMGSGRFLLAAEGGVEFKGFKGWEPTLEMDGNESFWIRGAIPGPARLEAVARNRPDYVDHVSATIAVDSSSDPIVVEPVLTVVSSGGDHACGLTETGEAYCWGAGAAGQLGNGLTANQPSPVLVSGAHTFKTISAGDGHTCALTPSGQAYCWGAASFGKLGTVAPNTSVPNPVTGAHSFTMISAGDNHTCAVTASGQAYCWGSNAQGRLGNGSTAGSNGPTLVSGGHTFATIAAGGSHSCAVTATGAAYCWGWAGRGQLGHGSGVDQWSPHPVSGGHAFVSITAGREHSCGVTESGVGMCWGQNNYGQLGVGASGDRGVPTVVVGGHTFEYLSTRTYTTCGVTTAGQVYCFGNNDHGQIGDGTTSSRGSPTLVPGSFVEIGTGASHACALNTEGVAYCWGRNNAGQLGNSGTADSSIPVLSLFSRRAIGSVALEPTNLVLPAGGSRLLTAAVRDVNGYLVSRPVVWSSDNAGVAVVSSAGEVTGIAIGTTTIRVSISGFVATAAIMVVQAVQPMLMNMASGGDHSCGLTEAGDAYCWGAGTAGQLGNGSTANQSSPVLVSGGHAFKTISVGGGHTCALTLDGKAYCWGAGSFGKLGDGTGTQRTTPTPVAGGHTFAMISAGENHTCAVTAAGGAYCWGSNGQGRLGNGTTTGSSTPSAVSGGHPFATISAGGSHTCGITSAGAAYCWGWAGRGQLGHASGTDQWSPYPVSGGHVFTSITTGREHSCGVTVSGEGECWGQNNYGQLGIAAFGDRGVPSAVVGGYSYAYLSAHTYTTCGTTTDGQVYCWGNNDYGQVGDGSASNRDSPRLVSGNFTDVSTGVSHSCGLNTQGVAYCWGRNNVGQLGNNGTADSPSPVPSLFSVHGPVTSPDTTPPVVSGFVYSATTSSITVRWLTDKPATSQLYYGSGINLPLSELTSQTQETINFTTQHQVILSNLAPTTWYTFRATGRDATGNRYLSENNGVIRTSSAP